MGFVRGEQVIQADVGVMEGGAQACNEVHETAEVIDDEETQLGAGEKVGRGVPEIDLGGGEVPPERRAAVAAAMVEAWRTWGAFLVVNHGVEQAVVEGAREQGMRVFALPLDTKLRACREAGEFGGYGNAAGSRATDTADFGSESFRVGIPGTDTATFAHKLWPGNCASFCEKYEAYIGASEKLSSVVVQLLSEGLPEQDRSHINSYFPAPQVGSVRLNYYPASATHGLPPHTDAAALVLLHQSDGGEGLQLHNDGHWVTVQARSDAFVVIMGTVYQILTNGEYKAGRHRAVKGGNKERLSMVFSLWPKPTLPMTPAPTFLASREQQQQRLVYQAVTFEEFWEAREADLLNPLQCILQPHQP